jgi:hypothetical protein
VNLIGYGYPGTPKFIFIIDDHKAVLTGLDVGVWA